MPAIAIPLILKVGIPLATYAIGHIVGFIHGKKAKKQKEASNVLGVKS